MPYDWDRSITALAGPNPFIGLTSRDGKPWPALRAFRVLVERLDGFVKAEKRPAPPNVELFRFTFEPPRAEVWVAWLRQDRPLGLDDELPKKKVRLKMVRAPAVVRAIPSSSKAPAERRFAAGEPVFMELDPTPVVIHLRRSAP